MDPKRPDRILQEWNEVADGARRPAAPPTRIGVRGGASGTNLAGALVLVAAVVIAVAWLGRPGGNGGIGAIGSTVPDGAGHSRGCGQPKSFGPTDAKRHGSPDAPAQRPPRSRPPRPHPARVIPQSSPPGSRRGKAPPEVVSRTSS